LIHQHQTPVRNRALLAIVFVVGILVTLASVAALSTLRNGRLSIDAIGAEPTEKDRLDALLLVRDIDTARQKAKLRLYLDPVGRFADNTGRFAQNIAVDSSNENGAAVVGPHFGRDGTALPQRRERVLQIQRSKEP
jgi:hypothetical protein